MGGFFGEEFFGRNFLVDFYKELMFLSRFWGNFVSMEGRRKEGRRKEDFRSLEVRCKLIALKNAIFELRAADKRCRNVFDTPLPHVRILILILT